MKVLNCGSLALLALTATSTSYAQVTLAGDDPPTDPLWKKPATVSYTRNGDGTSTAAIDGVLRYKGVLDAVATSSGARQTNYNAGIYVHRNSSSSAPKNDRGVSLALGEAFVPDLPNDKGLLSFNLQGKLTYGNSLQESKDAACTKAYNDKTKDRAVVKLASYYQPAKSGVPPRPGTDDRPTLDMYFDGVIGLYSDNSRGGDGKGNGRVSGTMVAISANFAPFGLDPSFSKFGTLGFVPTFQVSAQRQRDSSAGGERIKQSRTLYSAGVSLSFSKLDEKTQTVVPSLNLARSVGADLLAGRADTAKTELTFGLSF
jgi:hypothetical protein